MEQERLLSGFFNAIAGDPRISITHIGIYAALLQCRLLKGDPNPLQVFCREVLEVAKLSSALTYLRCVRNLHDYGYLKYERSFKKNQGSLIYFMDADHCNYNYLK